MRPLVVFLALILAAPVPAPAQQASSVGTLLVAHGASAEWNAQVVRLAAEAEL